MFTFADDQERDICAFLRDPASHGDGTQPVEVVETHIARVFLVGSDAYKLRKRVHLRFVDFSTLHARHAAAVREMEINRPHAPNIYLGLVPIVRSEEGRYQLGGYGEIVEWAVHMRRFPQEAVLSRREEQGPIPEELAKALADMVARYHQDSPISEACNGERIMAPVVDQLSSALAFGYQDVADRLVAAFEKAKPLLTERGNAGCVRRCHGDLHLGNIVLIDNNPVPFDALEFSEALATIDVLYDLAFLLMDLEARGDHHAANAVFNAYIAFEPIGGEIEGLATLPLFLACRAGVRAVVGMARTEQLELEAQTELRAEIRRNALLAGAYLSPPPPVLIAIGGLSGTGKSTLASLISPCIGPAPGALHIRSDVERKRLFGIPETQKLDRQHYRVGTAERVYSIVEDKARRAIAAGHAAIVDAVFAKQEERETVEAIARDMGCAFVGLWLSAPAETLIQRVEQRRGDASDADRRVVREQLGYDLGTIHWHEVDASGSPEQSLAEARQILAAVAGSAVRH